MDETLEQLALRLVREYRARSAEENRRLVEAAGERRVTPDQVRAALAAGEQINRWGDKLNAGLLGVTP